MYGENHSLLLAACIALIVGLLGTDAICLDCPPGWAYYNQSCYIPFIKGRVTWMRAYQKCASLNSQLLEINSEEEAYFVRRMMAQLFPNSRSTPKRIWLGCKKIDGRKMCSEHNQQQLALSLSNGQICTVLSPFISEYTDIPCSRRKRVLCEKQIQHVQSHARCQATTKRDANLTIPLCLLDHFYMTTPINHLIQCCKACHKDPNCRSFNLLGMMCYLNNVTISQVKARQYIVTRNNCVHYSLERFYTVS